MDGSLDDCVIGGIDLGEKGSYMRSEMVYVGLVCMCVSYDAWR